MRERSPSPAPGRSPFGVTYPRHGAGTSRRTVLGARAVVLNVGAAMKRTLLVLVLLVLVAGCDSGMSSSPKHGQDNLGTRPPDSSAMPQGARAQKLCRDTFGRGAVESAATTVGRVRASGIGVLGGVFASAFRGSPDTDFAAWCMIKTDPHCYDESAVAATGDRVHIAPAGCGSPSGPPRAGPAYWTL